MREKQELPLNLHAQCPAQTEVLKFPQLPSARRYWKDYCRPNDQVHFTSFKYEVVVKDGRLKVTQANSSKILPICSYPRETWRSIFTTFRLSSEYSWTDILLAIKNRICYSFQIIITCPFFFFFLNNFFSGTYFSYYICYCLLVSF